MSRNTDGGGKNVQYAVIVIKNRGGSQLIDTAIVFPDKKQADQYVKNCSGGLYRYQVIPAQIARWAKS